MPVTTYVVTPNSLYPGGMETEDEWETYPEAVNGANRRAAESSNNTTFYVHEKVTRAVFKSQRNVSLLTEVIDEDGTPAK